MLPAKAQGNYVINMVRHSRDRIVDVSLLEDHTRDETCQGALHDWIGASHSPSLSSRHTDDSAAWGLLTPSIVGPMLLWVLTITRLLIGNHLLSVKHIAGLRPRYDFVTISSIIELALGRN